MEDDLKLFAKVIVLGAMLAFAVPSQAKLYTFGGDFDLPIPGDPTRTAGLMADAVIDVDMHLPIEQLTVSMTIMHENVFDLQIYLISPQGNSVALAGYDPVNLPDLPKNENWQNYIDTVFDDNAELPISRGQAPFTGSFAPMEGRLSDFIGQSPYGQWTLRIDDMWQGHTGRLEDFQLHFVAPEPVSAAFSTIAFVVLRLSGIRRRRAKS